MPSPRIGVYPGTFDPITRGHVDIALRASRMVDQLVIAVAANPGKNPLFTVHERMSMAIETFEALKHKADNIVIKAFDTLLMNFMQEQGSHIIIRGLRAVSDYEYEYQMAAINRKMNPNIETVFLTASDDCHFISSRFVRDIAWHGGDVAQFVPSCAVPHITARVKQKKEMSA